MEGIAMKILRGILANESLPDVEPNYLDQYYKILEEELRNGTVFSQFYEICVKIQSAYSFELTRVCEAEHNRIYQKLISACILFNHEEEDKDLLPMFAFLDQGYLLLDYMISESWFSSSCSYLEQLVWNTVNSIDVFRDYHWVFDKSRWKDDSFTAYKKATETFNLKGIYDYFKTIENGITFRFSDYVDFIGNVSTKLFFDNTVKALDLSSDLFKLVLITNDLTSKEKLKLATQSTNILFKFEVLRSTVGHVRKENYVELTPENNTMVEHLMSSLATDPVVWKKFTNYYLTNPSWFPIMFAYVGLNRSQFNESNVISLVDSIKFSRFNNELTKDALNSCFLKTKADCWEDFVLERVFFRWRDFIDSYNEYVGEIILTDLIDVVLAYSTSHLSKEFVIKDSKEIIYNIREIDNKWFKNKQGQLNYRYKQLSKLYGNLGAIFRYGLANLQKEIEYILANCLELKHEHPICNEITTLELFSSYYKR